MFTPARYVIVDDNADELKQLADCMQKIGAPCLPLRYDQAEGIETKHLGGVRLLFLDLHLTTGAQSGSIAQTAGLIVAMLEDGIVATAGPYVIILWTKHQEQKAAFEAYVMENLDPLKRPLAILSLDKNNYLAGDAGAKLTTDVGQIIETDPRLRAMLDWEREVLKAAGATLSEIGALVANEDRTAARFSERLDEILSLLAFEAVGSANAKTDPYSAVNAALMPILSDRVANQRVDPKSGGIWKAAVTKVEHLNQPSPTESAKLNSMLHVAKSSTEALSCDAWGAVTLLPEDELLDAPMMKRFDLPAKPMLSGTFCLTEKAERSASKLCLLRIGASCDYAQSRKGPIPFVLGAIIPAEAKRREALPKAEIVTPPLIIDGFDGPVRMIFNTHLQISMVPTEFAGWPALCRLREPLLMQITTHGARHATRPAIMSFGAHGG
ncbi:hypothetical protein HF265_15865 [Rhizobium leguminosarum]|uniref:hypothetical protein n=1 Tax=Rhizobium leguminosarum TaxID=384 RepID=UPI001C91AB9E|nr:hypothetical protein [Rhizobium leguminosarum]MBY3030571.1 hypothetical protein [Rhizobium leguminosarum]